MDISIEDITLEPNGNFSLSSAARLNVYSEGSHTRRWSLNQIRAHTGLKPLPYGDRLYTTEIPQGATE